MSRLRVSIVGASGYGGGELLRLLLAHPHVEVVAAASDSEAGAFVYQRHPNLRGQTQLRFTGRDAVPECDVVFLAMAHGEAQTQITRYAALAPRVIDLSADFRLRDAAAYEAVYGAAHSAPEWLGRFVYGLPELNREALRGARYASGVGCNATSVTLAVWALAHSGMLAPDVPLIADVKVGSSEAGRTPTETSHHAHRAGVVRPYALTGHRHEAEVRQSLAVSGAYDVRLAVTSVDLIRGSAAAVHVTLPTGMAERALWQAYREAWADAPFVRIVHERGGLHRHPEPRVVAGTNYADVGWEYEAQTGRAVLLCAIDNLGKGAAGSAVQSMNLMCGFDEQSGLTFGGFYP